MIFSFDIDGTLTEYPTHWMNYLNRLNKSNFKNVNQAKIILGRQTYSSTKDSYRKSEEKYLLPVRSEMMEATQLIYKLGGKVFINSSRPFENYPDMKEKTTNWLRNNNFQFESVEKKTKENFDKQKVDFHFDDEIMECLRLSRTTKLKKVYLIHDNAYRLINLFRLSVTCINFRQVVDRVQSALDFN